MTASRVHEPVERTTVPPIAAQPADDAIAPSVADAAPPLRMTIKPPRFTTTTPGVLRRTAR